MSVPSRDAFDISCASVDRNWNAIKRPQNLFSIVFSIVFRQRLRFEKKGHKLPDAASYKSPF
jgi:hypothetical protein